MAKTLTSFLNLIIGNDADQDRVLPDIAENFERVDAHAEAVAGAVSELSGVPAALATETQQRVAGDSALSQAITTETSARTNADADLADDVSRLDSALTAEANARATADAGKASTAQLTTEAATRAAADEALAAAVANVTATVGIGGDAWLIGRALANAFLLTGNQTYDPTFGTLTGSDFEWEDGTEGRYTGTLDSNGAVTEFTATYVMDGTSKAVTITIPRNAQGQVFGSMTASVDFHVHYTATYGATY